jgi:hypothetical protein
MKEIGRNIVQHHSINTTRQTSAQRVNSPWLMSVFDVTQV